MSRSAENLPSPIDTVPKAATELLRLHRALGAQAVELTEAYLVAKRAGVEGATWRWSPHLVAERLAILDPVIRIGDTIELGPAILPLNERSAQFRLTNTGESDIHSITVERQGAGLFKAGEKYWVRDKEILRANYTSHQMNAPWPGGFSGTITSLDHDSYSPVGPEDTNAFAKLTRLITDMSFYEIPIKEPGNN